MQPPRVSRLASASISAWLLGLTCLACQPDASSTEAGESGETSSTNPGDGDGTSDSGDDSDTDTGTDTGEAVCGDGVVEGDEQCDDGNDDPTDACANDCTLPVCGDGVVQTGEGCDAGADNGPGKPCKADCQPNVCGDGELGPGESCDDGNDVDDDGCTNACALASCGDGQLDLGEACDDGNDDDSDACLSTCVAASCGDGFEQAGVEACDAGPGNSDTAACTSSCTEAVCGDGLVWFGEEQCDLGDGNGPNAACLDDCVDNVCGDGFPGPGQACDDGNEVDDDGCTNACTLPGCGDGVVQDGEECDDANEVETDGCTSMCLLPACGDGFVHAGEACDDGDDNANDATCTLACELAECGDGLVHAGVEQCDNGDANANDAACKADCTDNLCGDGFQGPGEGCDDGNQSNADACTNACTLATCGDGFVQPGEACDDGNDIVDDGCTNACTLPMCGDGIVQAGETCDAGNNNGANAACTPACQAATCGDSYVWAGVEDCDDGNQSNTDACTNACESAGCGDGYVWAGNEACDDGNMVDDDGCSNACELPYCGDGLVQGDEECDDNDQLNDGCMFCEIRQVLQLDAGYDHTCAVVTDGKVRCWGSNQDGKLGIPQPFGEYEPKWLPDVQVGAPATQVCAGRYHSCAVVEGGAVRCWGRGQYGRLGYANQNNIGDNEHPSTAGDVQVGGSVTQIACGTGHTCALLANGAVRCWGDAQAGQLGYGNTTRIGDTEHPFTAGDVDVGGTVTQIALGEFHSCALLDTGGVRCWGQAGYGKLGYPNQVDSIGAFLVPADVGDIDLGGTAVQITAGTNTTCARLDDGSVRCWGRGDHGELGYSNTLEYGDDEHPSAAPLVQLGGPAIDLSTGGYHTCALLQGGSVRCWGFAEYGVLGYGNLINIGDDEHPDTAGPVSLGGNIVDIDTGFRASCATYDSGALRCWGGKYYGIGYDLNEDIGDDEVPSQVFYVQVW